MTATKPVQKGAVDLASLKGKTPDSVRIHPYNPSVHAACKYEMEPDTRPPDYNPRIYFNMAKRKVYMLMLGLVIGSIIIGAAVAIIVRIYSKSQSEPVFPTPVTDEALHPGTCRSAICCNHPKRPLAHTAIGDEFVFVDDNATPHCARVTNQYLEDNGIERMTLEVEWRARSPDCNPIENLWDDIKQTANKKVNDNTSLQE